MAKSKRLKKSNKSRPIGATVVAVYFFIVGILALLGVLLMASVGTMFINQFLMQNQIGTMLGAFFTIVLLIIGLFYIITGFGLWKLKKWAQIVATVLAVVGLFGGPLSLVLSIGIILLLWIHKDTKNAFS